MLSNNNDQMPKLEISKFAAAAQQQYQVGKGKTHISLNTALTQLENILTMDNQVIAYSLRQQGYSETQILEAQKKKFKPTLTNLLNELININSSKKVTIATLEKLIASSSNSGVNKADNMEFLEFLKTSNFIVNHGGSVYISLIILQMLIIRHTDLGLLHGAFVIDKLSVTDLSNSMPSLKGDNDHLVYVGFTKARMINLEDLLIDLSFTEEFESDGGRFAPSVIYYQNYIGLLKSLTSKIESMLQPKLILNFAIPIESESDLSTMSSLGFNIFDSEVGGLELISWKSLNLKPSPMLVGLIVENKVKVVISHIKVPRGRDFKFESLEFSGDLYDDFYRVCASHGDAWVRKENQV